MRRLLETCLVMTLVTASIFLVASPSGALGEHTFKSSTSGCTARAESTASLHLFLILVLALAVSTTSCTETETSDQVHQTVHEIVGLPRDDSEKVERYLHNERQSFIRDCMTREGFAYQMTPYPGLDSWSPTSRSEVAEFGFGITGVADQVDSGTSNTEGMTENEVVAYEKTLSSEDGSERKAHEAQTIEGGMDSEIWDELWQVFDQAASDPRTIELDRQWSRCLEEQGLDISAPTRNELVDELYQELAPLLAETLEGEHPTAVVDREREVALAAWDCEVPLAEEREQIVAEYQSKFIQKHEEVLLRVAEFNAGILEATGE